MNYVRGCLGLAATTPVKPLVKEDKLRCPRSATVRQLAEILDEEYVVQVHGTPTSGKTTLAGLLLEHYQNQNVPAVLIPSWPKHSPKFYSETIVEHARLAGFKLTVRDLPISDFVLILDEAQMSYGDSDLWLGFIKTQTGKKHGPRVCIFSAYGIITGGAEQFEMGSPLGFLGVQKRVSVTVSRVRGAPSIALFYNKNEFEDVARRICGDRTKTMKMNQGARDLVFSLTGGHPGAVASMLGAIYHAFRVKIKYEKHTVSAEDVSAMLDDEDQSFEYFARSGLNRCLPPRNADPIVTVTLRRLLVQQSIPLDDNDEGTRYCHRMGWIHAEALDYDASTVVCVFPTRLHAKFVERYMTGSSTPFPTHRFPSIEKLAEEVIKGFSLRNLSSAARLGTNVVTRPVESCYQDEFYRSVQELLGFSSRVVSEWTGDGMNRIDFRLEDPKWGIEILREGDRLGEHCKRFIGTGKYASWIPHDIVDWLIIDCRTSPPRQYEVPGTKLWRVVFARDFTSAEILNANNEVVVKKFALSG